MHLNELPKEKTHPITYLEKFSRIREKLANHLSFFTDVSKNTERTGSAAVLDKTVIKKQLPNEASIFSAIDIPKSNHQKFIILGLLISLSLLKKEKSRKSIGHKTAK